MFNNNGIEVTFKGHLTRDPELRYLADGSAVATLSVAVNRGWRDPSGADHQETAWVRCSVWGRSAEAANQYLRKGQLVTVRGRLQPDPQTGHPRLYQRQDGTVGAGYDVRVGQIDFGPRANGGNGNGNGNAAPAAPATVIQADDIPF